MIYTVGTVPDSPLYECSTFGRFLDWVRGLKEYQLDIETTMSEYWCDKEIITVQFGSIDKSTQWFLHWDSLNEAGRTAVKEVLENDDVVKLCHNGLFEYTVFRFHGIIIENIYDTMLAEQCIYGGITSNRAMGESLYSLKTLAWNYCQIDMDKTYQTSFSHEPLIAEQVIYAIDDVIPLGDIRELQKPLIEKDNLWEVVNLEFEALCGYGDMTFNGIELNQEDWLKNLDLVEPLIEQSLKDLGNQVFDDPRIYQRALFLKNLAEEDVLTVNWNSGAQKSELLSWIAPSLEMYTKAAIQKFLKKNTINDTVDELLYQACNDGSKKVEEYLVQNHRHQLLESGYLIPAGQLTINWNSVDQVLPLIQSVEPKLKAMDEESMSKTTHPIIVLIQDYKDTLKLKTTYGEKFIEKYVEPDGKIRTSYGQIQSTGRVSSSRPNCQNIPSKKKLDNRYRTPFMPPPGSKLVVSDFKGQELAIIAYISKDPVWIEALETGKDLHSVCANLVYGAKWVSAAGADCEFFKIDSSTHKPAMAKCKCKKHELLRESIKSINFGLA